MTGNEVVDRALEAHGGLANWQKHRRLSTRWTFRGTMFKLRLREGQLANLTAEISTRAQEVEVSPFPKAGLRARFGPNRVEILDEAGQVRSAKDNPRAAFGLGSLFWWSDFQMLYFAGYVLWNYSQLPFILAQPGVALEAAGTSAEGWNKVTAHFPDGFATHSPVQTFYFDSENLLRRHDYWVGIMAKAAKGARFIHSYQEVAGFKLPSRIEMKLGTRAEKYLESVSLGFVDFDDMRLS